MKTLFLILTFSLFFASCALFKPGREPDSPYDQAINEGHIVLGMPMTEVRRQWGEPMNVQADGDPSQGNQLWTYSTGLMSHYGLGNTRSVYFEGGRVVGWKTSAR